MKKYIEIAKVFLKQQFMWRADNIFNLILTVTKIAFAYILWGAVFQSKDVVAGFTFQSMLSYYLISAFLSQLERSGEISKEISTKIRNGTFSKYMVLPVNIQKYYISMQIGTILFYLGCNLLAAMVWNYVFKINFVMMQNPLILLYAVVLILLGLLFMIQLNYFLGILAFKLQEISTILMIKDNLLALITGSMIPLALLPEKIVECMKLFPFYYVTYLPSMLLIGRCKEEALLGVFVMMCWILAFAMINNVIYKKYRIKYDGVGI